MSKWKGKAIECLPELKPQIAAAKDRQSLWREIMSQFYAAKKRGDSSLVTGCLRYAAWILHPTPHAKTMGDVSELAAQLLYDHADELYRWIDRYDFMIAQKGLRFHLGNEKYSEFKARFLKKTSDYLVKEANKVANSRRTIPPVDPT
ncbi:MAG: hypothetical protein ACK4UN_03155 [Limisphaerales bacterium]